jgi:tetratricopeptide (TPR) repeat protein
MYYQFRRNSRACQSNNGSEHFEFSSVYNNVKASSFSKRTASSAIFNASSNSLVAPLKKFRLKTLEEHRFATRFDKKKKVQKDNWLRAKRHAYQLIKTGSRPEQAEALYLLLEIIDMHPHGCNLAKLHLNVGSIYVVFEHYEEAARAYRSSLIMNPENWKAAYNLGLALAKKEDFADAKWHFDQTILMNPPDQIAEEIASIIEEIEYIQRKKTRKTMKETKNARIFTQNYLEAMKLMTTSGDPAEVPDFEDYTKELFHDRLTFSSSYLLFDHAKGWKGVIASLLHRLYVHSAVKFIHVEEELFKYDPTNKGHISMNQLEELMIKSTGKGLQKNEKEELLSIFKLDGKIIYRMLIPNIETVNTVEKILQIRESKKEGEIERGGGLYYAAFQWRLAEKSYRRSDLSKTKESFWFYLEMSLRRWIQSIDSNTLRMKWSICEKVLNRNQIFTPMHFVWNNIIEPEQLSGITFSDRGVLIYEAHQVVESIKQAAAIVLQMFYKRVFLSRHLRQKCIHQRSLALGKHPKSKLFNSTADGYSPLSYQKRIVLPPTKSFLLLCGSEDLKKRLQKEVEVEQEILCIVMERLDTLVDEVTVRHFHYQHEEEARLSRLEIPVRTETRQKTNLAIASLQNMLKKDSISSVIPLTHTFESNQHY